MGLDLGLENTGRFEVIACLEKEPAFCDSIRGNKSLGHLSKRLKIIQGDIAEIDPQRLLAETGLRPGELDVLVGGPPCQSFSTAGRRRTTQDPRGTLLWHFLRYVEVLRPKVFLMENVRGLLSAALVHRPIATRPERGGMPMSRQEEPGSVVRLFASDLRRIGGDSYRMDCFEVNAVNYGAPQLRERAIFIGNRYNAVVDFPDPTHGPFAVNGSAGRPWRTLRDALRNLRETSPVLMDFSPRKKHYLSLVPPGSNWRSLPERLQRESLGRAFLAKGGRSGWWRRLSFDLPCPTLVTMPNHASTSLCHPQSVRALTVREYARVQEFPDHWTFCGTPAQQYAQVGNAVPVRLGEVSGKVIASLLDKLRQRRWRGYRKDDAPVVRRVYVHSHVRTRSWFKDGEVFVLGRNESPEAVAYAPPRTLRKTSFITESDETSFTLPLFAERDP